MKYSLLHNTDIRLSCIGFGCMSLDPAQQTQSQAIIHEAIEKGVTFFDTADLYNNGANEEMLGKAIANKRNKVIIATKVGNQMNADGKTWVWNASKTYILQAIDKSLQRLKTDYVDLYQLHGGTLEDPIDETIEAFERLKSQGKIREYGISSIRPSVIRLWLEKSGMKTLMSQYSLLDQRPAETVLPLAIEDNIGVLARGGLAQGLLAGKPAKTYLDRTQDMVEKAAGALAKIDAKHHHCGVAALQFVLRHRAIASAVVGIRTREHLETAIEAAETRINENDYQNVLETISPNRYTENR